MKQYQTYLFDWDGCLCNTLPPILDSYIYAFKQFNLHPTKEEIVDISFGDWNGPIKSGLDSKKLDDFNKILLSDIKKKHSSIPLHLHAKETLSRLKKSAKNIAIVSTGAREGIEELLKLHKIDHLIEFIIAAKDVSSHKPDPEGIHKAMKFFNSSPQDTVMIGDSPKDTKAGHNAGIDTIAYYPQINQDFYNLSEIEKQNPTYIISSLSKIINDF